MLSIIPSNDTRRDYLVPQSYNGSFGSTEVGSVEIINSFDYDVNIVVLWPIVDNDCSGFISSGSSAGYNTSSFILGPDESRILYRDRNGPSPYSCTYTIQWQPVPPPSPSPTLTPTITITPTNTPTVSITPTISITPTTTITITPTNTPTVSITPTISTTPTTTPTISTTPTTTPTISTTPTTTPTNTPIISIFNDYMFLFIDEALNTYCDPATNEPRKEWYLDLAIFNNLNFNLYIDVNKIILFHVRTSKGYRSPIFPFIGNNLYGMPINLSNVLDTPRFYPKRLVNNQLLTGDWINDKVSSICGKISPLSKINIFIDNSPSLTINSVLSGILEYENILALNKITYQRKICQSERWLRWISNTYNNTAICS